MPDIDFLVNLWYNIQNSNTKKGERIVPKKETSEKPRGKATTKPNPPKDPATVKHGCCSCTSYRLAMSQEPCKSCHDWNNWVDEHPERSW